MRRIEVGPSLRKAGGGAVARLNQQDFEGYQRRQSGTRPVKALRDKPGVNVSSSIERGSSTAKNVPLRSSDSGRTLDKWLLEDAGVFGDGVKEQGRFSERNLSSFTFHRWASHRSTARYIRHMKGIFQSSIVRGLAQPLLSVAGIATIVCMYEDLLSDGVFPGYMPSLLMPTAPFDLTSFALALLLVFRTNTSYDRWLEVCTVWSGLGNRARDTMRQMISHLSDSSGEVNPLAGAMCRWLIAYYRALKCEVVENSDLSREIEDVLTPAEADMLLSARHRPSFALSVLTELGAAAPLRESHRIRFDENLTYFEDAVGTCERILTTPIPLSYTRHTSRFMVIWLSALPLGLYGTCGWATIPLSMVITFLLLGIDEIGVQIEEPFGLLPLDDVCDEIEGDLFSMLREAVSIKATAVQASIAARGLHEELSNLESTPYSPLPRTKGATIISDKEENLGTNGTMHREWEEVTGRIASNDEDPY